MTNTFTESVVEEAALEWLESLGYVVLSGPAIAPGELGAERDEYGQVVLEGRLREALERLNPKVPQEALEDAFRKLTRPDSPSLVANNHVIHKYLVEGVPVEYQRADGSIGGDLVHVLDHDEPENNEFLAVNQFTVVEDGHERRPDVVLFVNGLPVAVIELKNAADEDADIWKAFNQLQTYKRQIPGLFAFNEALVISDGVEARIGTLTANREWFMPWRTIEGEELADARLPQLRVVLEGVFEKRRLLDLIRYFIVFEDAGGGVLVKKMAGYHQYHAVNRALESTVEAAGAGGDRRVGVVWHTQGSGNRAIETAQVIEELIALAQDMREAGRRGEDLGLTDDEVAFYDALETNDSAVSVLGDDTLRLIAQELVRAVRSSITIDWTVRENVRAHMRVIIKRILRRFGYPPDKQARATELVLEQAEVLCGEWAA